MTVSVVHLSVADPMKPDPVDFFPSPSENLASPVPGKIRELKAPNVSFLSHGRQTGSMLFSY